MAQHAVIGSPDGNFWLYHSEDGFDLTHPQSPSAPKTHSRLTIPTQASKVTVDPAKTAMVVIDMQNYFLNPALGRPADSNGLRASEQLLKHALPACRAAGIQVIWMNWGLTDEDIKSLPPSVMRTFGFETKAVEDGLESFHPDTPYHAEMLTGDVPKGRRRYKGPGCELGLVEIDDGISVDGGRLLVRDQWNSALWPPLEQARKESLNGGAKRPDVWVHKNRMSGLWGAETECSRHLDQQGIRTLLFAGVNTDQCVGGTLQDAFTRGYDCLLLSDGAATTSPSHAQQCIEYNSLSTWGFVLSCEQLAEGVKGMQHS